MLNMTILGIPLETTMLNFAATLVSESICLITILVMAVWSIFKYSKDPRPLKRLVLFIGLTYLVTLIIMLVPKFLLFFDYITPVDFSVMSANYETYSGYVLILNMAIFWEFECEVFSDAEKINRTRLLYFIPLALLFIVVAFQLVEYQIYSSFLLLLSLTLYGRLFVQSAKIKKRVDNFVEKVRVGLLFWAGIIMIISYVLSVVQGILQNYDSSYTYSILHIIAALFGSVAILIFFLSVFQPTWLLLRLTKEKELPQLDLSLNPVVFEDDLPKLTENDMKKGLHFSEWWYFDFEDFETKAKVVAILKRADTTLYPENSGIHVEWTSPDGESRKLYKKISFNELKSNSDGQKMHVELYPNNYFEETKGKSMAYENIRLHIEIGNIKIEMNGISKAPGIKFGPSGAYYNSKLNSKKHSSASLSVPLFTGNATINVGEKTFSMNCSGYHDHVYATSDFLETHKKWYWARAYFGDAYLMYAEVFPQKMYYGLMKYLYIIPKLGETPIYDNKFVINAQDFKKEKGFAFPRKIEVISNELNTKITLNFKEVHVDQAVYNRSIFDISMEGKDFNNPIKSTAFVEYFSISPLVAKLSRKMVLKQYKKWLVD